MDYLNKSKFGNLPETFGTGAVGKFVLKKHIKSNCFSAVFKCQSVKDNSKKAVKVFPSNFIGLRKWKEELAILKFHQENRLQDWNCVGVFTHFVITPKGKKTNVPFPALESQVLGYPCIMFELLGKDLWSYQRKQKSFEKKDKSYQSDGSGVSVNTARQILLQVWVALQKFKSIGFVHGDLTLRNIAISNKDPNNFQIKILDFGNAVFDFDLPSESECDSHYKAPEMTKNLSDGSSGVYGCAADLWSLGCVAFELATGYRLFDQGGEVDQLLAKLRNKKTPSVAFHLLKNLLQDALNKDGSKDKAALKDVDAFIEVVFALLNSDPLEREKVDLMKLDFFTLAGFPDTPYYEKAASSFAKIKEKALVSLKKLDEQLGESSV